MVPNSTQTYYDAINELLDRFITVLSQLRLGAIKEIREDNHRYTITLLDNLEYFELGHNGSITFKSNKGQVRITSPDADNLTPNTNYVASRLTIQYMSSIGDNLTILLPGVTLSPLSDDRMKRIVRGHLKLVDRLGAIKQSSLI